MKRGRRVPIFIPRIVKPFPSGKSHHQMRELGVRVLESA